ncbi:Hypothetical protein BIBO2_1369 [Brucella sp. BO2]|nr:Hypothetical protein BIBO2_1369 [Brucella sp. BO2]
MKGGAVGIAFFVSAEGWQA